MHAISPRRSRILVMHRDPLLCAGLAAALCQHEAFEVHVDGVDAPPVATVDVVIADYAGAIRLAEAHRAARGTSHPRILVLTADDREADIRRAVEAGIHGYLLLGGPLSELVEGVKAVAGGVRYFCRAVAQRMADSLTHAALTSREMDVLELVAMGESNKAIARRLRIEVGTVKSHMSAIMTKLGAASRTQAASIAASRGLVEKRAPVERPTLPAHGSISTRTAAIWSLPSARAEAHA